MDTSQWTTRQRWVYALKPGSWPKLLVPTVVGQALGVAASGRMDVWALGFGVVFTLALGVFIVLLNDWGDVEVDRLKRAKFPGECSPKTIPDGILSARAVLVGGVAAGFLALVVGGVGAVLLERAHLWWGALVCLATFVAYTLPPLRFNYRGGGELLEMIGVGMLLPWWSAYAQSGQMFHSTWVLLGGYTAFSLASALASGLSDEVTDREGGKRTFATMCGNRAVRRAIEMAMFVGVMAWMLAPYASQAIAWWTVAPAVAVALAHTQQARRISGAAKTNAFAAQKRYKQRLHEAIWYGGLALSAALLVRVWWQ